MPKRRKSQFRHYERLGPKSLFPSLPKQILRLHERRSSEQYCLQFNSATLTIFPGVYRTGIDTELMIDTIRYSKDRKFLEIGCGTGAVSIALATACKKGIAVDINPRAVENTKFNCIVNNIINLDVLIGDVFEQVTGQFDIIVCNPPYNTYPASDEIDNMFWDTDNKMKLRFFENVSNHLAKNGRVYFGWADFEDLDFDFPIRCATANGLELKRSKFRLSKDGLNRFIVFEFGRSAS